MKRSIGERNNGGEEARKGIARNVERDRVRLGGTTEVRREELDSFFKDARVVHRVGHGSRFLWPALSGSLQFCAMQSAR